MRSSPAASSELRRSKTANLPAWSYSLTREWKNQSVPLHAFIAAQITVSHSAAQFQAAADRGTMPRDPRCAARESRRVAALDGVDVSSNPHFEPEDSRSAQSNGTAPMPLKRPPHRSRWGGNNLPGLRARQCQTAPRHTLPFAEPATIGIGSGRNKRQAGRPNDIAYRLKSLYFGASDTFSTIRVL
jgi:hypothetical protein